MAHLSPLLSRARRYRLPDTHLDTPTGHILLIPPQPETTRRRVLLLTTIPAPYRLQSFQSLSVEPTVELTVGFLARRDPRWPWRDQGESVGFRAIFLDPYLAGVPAATRTLVSLRPHVVVVGGWDQLAYAIPYMLKPLLRYRIVVWSESTARDQRRGSRARRATKQAFIRLADAVLVPGSAAAGYARTLGAKLVVTAPNACDTRIFRAEEPPEVVPRVPTQALRSPFALFVGRLAAEKGIDVLLRAWQAVEARADADLVLIGSGPCEAALKSQEQALRLRRVRWVPFSQPEDLVSWYRRAAVLVLPSRSEPWGFVINEAMACGLPVIASEACGAAYDLVLDGVTGWRVERDDPASLAEHLVELLSDAALQQQMGMTARAMAASFTPEHWSKKVAQLVGDLTDRMRMTCSSERLAQGSSGRVT